MSPGRVTSVVLWGYHSSPRKTHRVFLREKLAQKRGSGKDSASPRHRPPAAHLAPQSPPAAALLCHTVPNPLHPINPLCPTPRLCSQPRGAWQESPTLAAWSSSLGHGVRARQGLRRAVPQFGFVWKITGDKKDAQRSGLHPLPPASGAAGLVPCGVTELSEQAIETPLVLG